MVIRKTLTDYSSSRVVITNATNRKIIQGKFDQNLHDIFKPSSLKIRDVEAVILAIERKLRSLETICYTFFDSEYDPSIIIHQTLSGGRKVIETEFNYSTRVIANKIEFDDSDSYEESIHVNFQTFILTVASLYENIVRLIETFLKKITVHGKTRNPHQSVPMGLLVEYWHNLVELSYRRNDDFYQCIVTHQTYLEKYLKQINTLRNLFIHGYSSKLLIQNGALYVDSVDGNKFPLIAGGILPPELLVDKFVNHILVNSQALSEDFLILLERKLTHHMTKFPM
ncbi:MAG: hypothetical protein HWE22_16955 [Flavobacteriales bacterium]|nr:hypothetical protein [Flavobacteriales bacterium]